MNKKLKRWLPIIIIGFVIILLISTLFNKYVWNGLVTRFKTKIFLNNIAKQEQKYKNDKYGGKTPEETYQMFLNALKNKDIELASKYFVLDEQDRYKQALYEIEKQEKWELMMSDLTQKNTKWTAIGNMAYTLELFDENNMFLTQIDFSVPSESFSASKPISDIWKISSF